MTGWTHCQSTIISSSTALYNHQLEYTIIIGSGTSTGSTIYIPSNHIRSDFGDIRFRINKLFIPYTSISISATQRKFYVRVPYIYEGTQLDVFYGRPDEKTWESPYDTYTYYDQIYDANRLTISSGTTYMDYNGNTFAISGTPTGLATTPSTFTLEYQCIEIRAAISNHINTGIQLLSSGNHLITFRRTSSNYLVAEYDMNTSSNITLNTGIHTFTIRGVSSTITEYLIDNTVVYTYNNTNAPFISPIRFAPASNGTIVIDSIIVRSYYPITYGSWTTQDESSYYLLPFDQQCFGMTLSDEFPTDMPIDYTACSSYATTTLDPNQFIYVDNAVITLMGEYTYVHQGPSSITAWILPNTDPYPFTLFDTGKYTISITADKFLNVVLRNDVNVTLANYTTAIPFEDYNWSFFGVVHAFPSITVYTYTLGTDLVTSSTTYATSPPTSPCTTVYIGKSTNGFNQYYGLINAISIENAQLTEEDMLSIGCFASITPEPVIDIEE